MLQKSASKSQAEVKVATISRRSRNPVRHAIILLRLWRMKIDHSAPIYRVFTLILPYLQAILPPVDAAALALTCKIAWASFGGHSGLRNLLWRKKDYLRFWERMESRFSMRILCHSCGEFHFQHYIPAVIPCDMTKCYYENTLLIDSLGPLYLPFLQAKGVMNRHRYGRWYGPRVKRLGQYYRRTSYPGNPSYTRITADIVQGELIMKIDTSTVFWRQPMEAVRESSDWTRIRDMAKDKYWHEFLEDLTELESSAVSYRCKVCFSERRFLSETQQKNYKEHGELRDTSWYNLGACNTQYDTKWLLATECSRKPHDYNLVHRLEIQQTGTFDDTTPTLYHYSPHYLYEDKFRR